MTKTKLIKLNIDANKKQDSALLNPAFIILRLIYFILLLVISENF